MEASPRQARALFSPPTVHQNGAKPMPLLLEHKEDTTANIRYQSHVRSRRIEGYRNEDLLKIRNLEALQVSDTTTNECTNMHCNRRIRYTEIVVNLVRYTAIASHVIYARVCIYSMYAHVRVVVQLTCIGAAGNGYSIQSCLEVPASLLQRTVRVRRIAKNFPPMAERTC